ncbi:acyltransferase family protein [Spirosoma flavus]
MINNLFNILSPFPALCIMGISLLTVAILSKVIDYQLQQVKYVTFDSLKGYLSIIVFISHSSTWYYYLRECHWNSPPNNLFAQVGYASIAIFFMITSFLFCNKLISGKIGWLKFYIGRVIRLLPVYSLAILTLCFIVFYLTHFTLNRPLPVVIKQITIWLMFTIKNDPDINDFENTWQIISRVAWTLRYEWLFYILLPVFGLIISRSKPNYYVILISICTTIYIVSYYLQFDFTYFSPFCGGYIAALSIRSDSFSKFAISKWGTISIIVLLTTLLSIFSFTSSSLFEVLPLTITTVIFSIIVGGNTVLNILTNSIARKLGQISYGIYLFHGIILFCLFRFIIGFEKAATLSSLEHWFYVLLVTPVIITLSFTIHIYVEVPAMESTHIVYKKIYDYIVVTKQKAGYYWNQVLSFK